MEEKSCRTALSESRISLYLLGPPPSMATLCSVMITLGHEVGLECEEVMSMSSRETRMKTYGSGEA